MAKSHFAIERPRKISISIAGYSAKAQTQAQKRKQQERKRRLKRKADTAAERQQPSTAIVIPEPPRITLNDRRVEDVGEIEALNRAASCPPFYDAERQLRAAFDPGEGEHADE